MATVVVKVVGIVVTMVVAMVVMMVVGMVRRFEWVFIASLLCGSIVAPWSAEVFIPPQPHRSFICATHPYCTTSTSIYQPHPKCTYHPLRNSAILS